MSRIFIFGDSFGANLFEEYYNNIKRTNKVQHPIEQYLVDLKEDSIEDAMWFSDWLSKWGYEVYNYALPGSDNITIVEQFHKLNDDYRDGDRIIIWYSSFLRYQWFLNNGNRYTITSNFPPEDVTDEKSNEVLMQQCINRYTSSKESYIKNDHVNFLMYFTNLHSKYKPIVTSFCAETKKTFRNYDRFLALDYLYSGKLVHMFKDLSYTMYEESNGKIDDGHFSRETNYIYAIIFDEIIKNNASSNYNTNIDLFNIIVDRIEKEKVEFKIPKKWNKNYGTKKIFTNII